jgi:hypothetical protein
MSVATTVMGALIGLGGIAWGADLYRMVGWNFLAEQFLAVVLGLAMGIIFLIKPLISSSGPTRASAPWYDWVLSLGSVALGVYLSWHYPRMLGEFFNSPLDVVVCCSLLFVLVVEGLRRASGWALVIVVLAFFAYALAGHMVGGALQTPPRNGTIAFEGGVFRYVPNLNFPGATQGSDSFTYTSSDGDLTSSPATVTVTVTPVNDPPVFAGAAATTASFSIGLNEQVE